MTKRICPSCGLGAYSADTVTTWICAQCGGPIPPSCEVEMERCKPDRLNEIRERAENATPEIMRIHRDMLDICTMNFYDRDSTWFYTWISEWFNAIKQFWPFEDIPLLLDEITRLRAELDAANKRAEAAVRDMKFIADKINGCKSYLSGGTEKVGDLHLGRCSVCQRACESGDGCHFEWRGKEARNENSRSV